jgi:hypothetical protein
LRGISKQLKENNRMTKKIINIVILMALLAVGLFGMVRNASADAVYHTERLELEPVGGAPLRSGSVVNIHANGPNVYAREVYQLNGAAADSTYQVVLLGYLGSTSCSGTPDLMVPTAVIHTNTSGNGLASFVFRPADVAGLNGLTVGVMWQVWNGASLDYQTGCTAVTLD